MLDRIEVAAGSVIFRNALSTVLRLVLLTVVLSIPAGIAAGEAPDATPPAIPSTPDPAGSVEAPSSYLDDLIDRARRLIAGDGVSRDPTKAAVLLDQAARAGATNALILLAGLYARGDGVERNFDRARELLEQAIAAGQEAAGLRALGDLYREADPPERDFARAVEAYEKAAALNDPRAMIALAGLIASGEVGPVDVDRAAALLEGAIGAGLTIEAARELSTLYLTSPNPQPEKAVAALQRAADAGDAQSMIELAEMFVVGGAMPPDFDRARILLETAISVGDARGGALSLGNLYRDAQGNLRDMAKAAEYYQIAANAGDSRAMLALADILVRGDGVPADFDRAVELVQASIKIGDARTGYRTLGRIYESASEENHDPDKAEEAYQAAVDLGDPQSMIALGRLIGTGSGIPLHFQRAVDLLQDAVDAGEIGPASRALGDLYRTAPADRRDLVKAIEAYEVAAGQGDPWAMIELAKMLGRGEGAVDFGRAQALIENAVAVGEGRDGWRTLGDLYRYADPPNKDLSKAIDAYQSAVDLGDIQAMLALSQLLGAGEGVPRDFSRARALIEAAIEAGAGADGWRSLGDRYRQAGPRDRDPALARAAYQKAIDLGDPGAMIALADQMATGDGEAVDFNGARALLELAAQNDEAEADALNALGNLYINASAEYRDPHAARLAFERAAALGDSWSMIALADLYERGDGMPVDHQAALAHLASAVAAGNVREGAKVIGDYSLAADDKAKAKANYALAADAGNARAAMALGLLLIESIDERQALVDASRSLKSAASILGSESVASAMMRSSSQSLVAIVQELLGESGYPGPTDGVHGQETEGAISEFCSARRIAVCDGSFISFDLVTALLSEP